MMNYVDLSESKLEGADFRGASIAGTSFEHAEVNNADFTGASGMVAADMQGISGVPKGLNTAPTQTKINWGGANFVPPSWGPAPGSWPG